MNIKLNLILAGLLSVATVFADETPKTFSYFLRDYPKQERDCYVQAIEVSKVFEQAAGVKVTESICLKETDLSYDLQLNYEANKKLNVVSTMHEPGIIFPDRYADVAICQKNLPKQVAIFESATGLKPFITYCSPISGYEKTGWAPGIDAVGETKRLPFSSGYHLFTSSKYIDAKEYLTGLRAALGKIEGILAEVIIHPQLAYDYVAIHYFAAAPQHFALNVVGRTRALQTDRRLCDLQKVEAQSILAGTANPPFAIHCGYFGPTGNWELNLATMGEPSLSWRNSVKKFHTYNECVGQRDGVVKTYQATEKGIRGGICSLIPESDSFYVILFKEIPMKENVQPLKM